MSKRQKPKLPKRKKPSAAKLPDDAKMAGKYFRTYGAIKELIRMSYEPGMQEEIRRRLEVMVGKKILRHNIRPWLHGDPRKRKQMGMETGMRLVEIQRDLLIEREKGGIEL